MGVSREVRLPAWKVVAEQRAACDPTVLAIDPGGTTGWCILSMHPDVFVYPDAKIVANFTHKESGQIYGAGEDDNNEREAIREILLLLREWPGAVVVIEDFIIRRPSTERSFLSPVRIASALRTKMYETGWDPAVMQPSSDMRTCSDERLKAWRLYDMDWIRGGHARDAFRHALVATRRAKAKPAIAAGYGWRTSAQSGLLTPIRRQHEGQDQGDAIRPDARRDRAS